MIFYKEYHMGKIASFVNVMAFAIVLSGCANMQPAIHAFEARALDSLHTTNDNIIRVWETAACGTPLSAVIRNPRVVPALTALCLPGSKADPSDMLARVPTQ